MESVDGANPAVALPERYVADPAWKYALGLALADGAAAIGAVDYAAVGLADNVVPEDVLAAPNDVFTPNEALACSKPRGAHIAETSSKAMPNTIGAAFRRPP